MNSPTVHRSSVKSPTLGDVLLAAAEASEADAATIVQSLFESGRVRFVRKNAQDQIDRLSRLLDPHARSAA